MVRSHCVHYHISMSINHLQLFNMTVRARYLVNSIRSITKRLNENRASNIQCKIGTHFQTNRADISNFVFHSHSQTFEYIKQQTSVQSNKLCNLFQFGFVIFVMHSRYESTKRVYKVVQRTEYIVCLTCINPQFVMMKVIIFAALVGFCIVQVQRFVSI